MRRVVFCPDDSFIDEASIIAKKNGLSINIGLTDAISQLDFDKKNIKVIEIPEDHKILYDENVAIKFHQNISYTNDFVTFSKDVYIKINNINYYPMIIEKHTIMFNIYESESGLKQCHIINGNTELESFDYYVH